MNHLFTPYRHKIFPHKCLLAYLEEIPSTYRKFIKLWSYKNGILLLYVSNTNIKFHLQRQKKPLQQALSRLYTRHPICKKYFPVGEIKIIFRYHLPNWEWYLHPPKPPSPPGGAKWERGEFPIETDNPQLANLFSQIKAQIQKRRGEKELSDKSNPSTSPSPSSKPPSEKGEEK
ncbi:MAG: hypothetical protein C6I01_05560 [Epsilonproteobacteria bacterium]|nr:hypothetical protein [Campylobacterota bacterium]